MEQKLESQSSTPVAPAVSPSEATEVLVKAVHKVLAQIEHSEQSFHVRLRSDFRDFLDAYDAHEDLTRPISRIRSSLEVAAAEASLKKGKFDEAKAIAYAGLQGEVKPPDFILCLGRIAVAEGRYDDALVFFREALSKGISRTIIYSNIALMYQKMERFDDADTMWREGFPNGYVTHRPYLGTGEPLRVLIVTSPLVGNIRYRLFLNRKDIDMTTFCADSFISDDISLPEHDIVFCSIGDADLCAYSLLRAKKIIQKTHAPILNNPNIVELTSRELISQRLSNVEGTASAQIERFSKEHLTQVGGPALLEQRGFSYPFLLRSPGFQNGFHFEMVESPETLAETAKKLPTNDILVLSYLNTRAEDGTVRKFRVMRINGKLYPIHLAVSHGWKVHYHSSAMEETEAFRDEERRFLENMYHFLGDPVIETLERIFEMLNLDYAGIDFSVDHQGRVAVFEANATMAILTPKEDPKWDYRREPIATALKAAASMVHERAICTPLRKAA